MSCSVIRGPIWRDRGDESVLLQGRGEGGVLPEEVTSDPGPHLSEPHGTLLGPHVAASRDGLGQLRDVVLPIGLCLTLGQPGAPVQRTHWSVGDPGLLEQLRGLRRSSDLPTQCPPHVANSSLMSCRRLMLGNFSCRSFFIPRLAPTGTTLMLLQHPGCEKGG